MARQAARLRSAARVLGAVRHCQVLAQQHAAQCATTAADLAYAAGIIEQRRTGQAGPVPGWCAEYGIAPGRWQGARMPAERPAVFAEPEPPQDTVAAARVLAAVAEEVRSSAVAVTALLGAGSPRAFRALWRAATDPAGYGFAPDGGPVWRAARWLTRRDDDTLAVQIAVTSLKLRLEIVRQAHPEILDHPDVHGLITALEADRQLAAARSLHKLLTTAGVEDALAAVAPVLTELLALNALLDENPFNDSLGWDIVGGRMPTVSPITGVPMSWITRLDQGEGRAVLVTEPFTFVQDGGGIVEALRNLMVIGSTGKVLLRETRGPDGVVRYLLHLPGMAMGSVRNGSPQDLVGAIRNACEADSPYTQAVCKALGLAEIPEGAELAIVGHSEGGAAAMNLAQSVAVNQLYRITHVIAVGSPIDFKTPASASTWVASVTNHHDIVPSLDGQGPGSPHNRRDDWYIVDYTDDTHEFPLSHSMQIYASNLENAVPEARRHIDEQLTPYRGEVLRDLVYQLSDR